MAFRQPLITGVIVIVIIVGSALGVYYAQQHSLISASSSSGKTPTFASASGSQKNVWSLSISLNHNSFPQGQTNDLVATQNLTNISDQTQTIHGAVIGATQYSVFYSGNGTLACSFYHGAYTDGNFSVGPGDSMSFNSTLPSYSYGPPKCSIADLPAGTYILEIFSAWGNGTGDNITPITSANMTITITQVISTTSLITSTTSYNMTSPT